MIVVWPVLKSAGVEVSQKLQFHMRVPKFQVLKFHSQQHVPTTYPQTFKYLESRYTHFLLLDSLLDKTTHNIIPAIWYCQIFRQD